ncbi:Uncharacterized conserved protein YdiU, UPF0061 family [Pedobacter westerhofensis]|uniref:Protein nucleotidyltransferase YdiU n=2 Tax=Pedobacter westerhofensis TaxID=425512 RepID=A0A521FEG4_9SPHI|nr:Uncharacterized conserved protein YdiU, UPF0061 family [Pedobacter westerhofensis]
MAAKWTYLRSMDNLSTKAFEKVFVSTFEGDHSGDLQPRQTPGVFYSKAIPTPVKQPELLAWSDELAAELGISAPNEQDISILGGNLVTPTMYPYANCYAGHQFGNWAGQLGDGRAITLGEWTSAAKGSFELQLKGAGPTPYSRRGDGRAVLRSSIREYLMSEAMHHLGVPTTRALALVATGDQVLRDMFYDGRTAYEPGAVVMRSAPSFLRFGSFEMLAARQETAQLQKLTDWTIEKFYPHITGEHKTITWFKEVMDRTAALIVEWLRVGFVHGVMNTDNMSVLGLTIDYGPYSFLDDYDPGFTPNTTDLPGRRYAFGRQHTVAYWNLGCLASAIAPLFENTEELSAALEDFKIIYLEKYYAMMGKKLGLDEVQEDDHQLIDDLEETLDRIKPDMTIFFQLLISLPAAPQNAESIMQHFSPSFYREPDTASLEKLSHMLQTYQNRFGKNKITEDAAKSMMKLNNPRFILRNYLLHQAIQEMEKGESTLFNNLEEAMKTPYSADHDEFFKLRPEWAATQPGSSTLSCSS